MAINTTKIVTVHFVGGPRHGKWLTGRLGPSGILAHVGQRHCFPDVAADETIAMVHQYEYRHIQGRVIVAKYIGPKPGPPLAPRIVLRPR